MYLKPMVGASPKGFKRGSFVGEHTLGDTISRKLDLFERTYVYFKNSGGAYSVEEKVILKNNIYKQVKRFDQFIKAGYSDNAIELANAQLRLNRVLDVSIKLMDYDTRKVEKDIKKLEPTQFEGYIANLKFE